MGRLYSIGAEAIADFTVSKYRQIADDIASKSDAVPHGVIAFKKNNPVPDIFHHPSAESAAVKYDSLADNPGEYAYIYLYRDKKPVDEGYFVATSTHETKFETKRDRERVGTGWILGGIALGLLGISMGFKRGK
jgi:hypothetical protein